MRPWPEATTIPPRDREFVAGEDAQTTHYNTFVWGYGSQVPFTGANYDTGFNVLASGGVFFFNGAKGVHVDYLNENAGTSIRIFIFGGGSSGEGIASERTAGVYQYGLDFYALCQFCMSIANGGFVGINTTIVATAGSQRQLRAETPDRPANANDGNGPIDAYIGGNGSGSDVQVGSMNSLITTVGFWNTAACVCILHIACSSISDQRGFENR